MKILFVFDFLKLYITFMLIGHKIRGCTIKVLNKLHNSQPLQKKLINIKSKKMTPHWFCLEVSSYP